MEKTYYLAEPPFWSIQGEGLRSGEPTVFVRMAGCNANPSFRCWRWCDSKFARSAEVPPELEFTLGDLLTVVSLPPLARWVCITGGEPLLQDLRSLVDALYKHGFIVQVETNGTVSPPEDLCIDHWTVSPKTEHVAPEFLVLAKEVKFVVSCEEDLRFAHLSSVPFGTHVARFLQPCSNSPEAVKLCFEDLKAYPTWRLSLQIHKLIGVQ